MAVQLIDLSIYWRMIRAKIFYANFVLSRTVYMKQPLLQYYLTIYKEAGMLITMLYVGTYNFS